MTTRRAFLAAAAAATVGIAAAPFQQPQPDPAPTVPPGGGVSPPDTLFLTWQRDPATTMTIQWVGPKRAPQDASIRFAGSNGIWRVQPTIAKPYPLSDLTLNRGELTDLEPGGDYRFQVGRQSTMSRFRTMPRRATDTISFI